MSDEKYQLKDNAGRAFKNDRRRDSKDASFTGKLRLVDEDGEETNCFLDMWINAKNPEHEERILDAIKYINVRVKKMKARPDTLAPSRVAPGGHQQDMGYSRQTPPTRARDVFAEEKAQAERAKGDRVPGPAKYDIGDDEIPFMYEWR